MLSNPEKRQQYDQCGEQPAAFGAAEQSGRARPGFRRTFHRDFEADISPEELFNIFFGGRFPTGGARLTPSVRAWPVFKGGSCLCPGNIHVYTNEGASYSQFYQPRRRRAYERREEVAEENRSQVGEGGAGPPRAEGGLCHLCPVDLPTEQLHSLPAASPRAGANPDIGVYADDGY